MNFFMVAFLCHFVLFFTYFLLETRNPRLLPLGANREGGREGQEGGGQLGSGVNAICLDKFKEIVFLRVF